jgi:uncharacterized protein with HEPN domain
MDDLRSRIAAIREARGALRDAYAERQDPTSTISSFTALALRGHEVQTLELIGEAYEELPPSPRGPAITWHEYNTRRGQLVAALEAKEKQLQQQLDELKKKPR